MLTFPNVIVAMVTPFHEDGSVNYEAAVELAKKYADEGSAILVGATTGEGAVMTEEEKLKLFQVTADALKDKTLVMGNVGTNNTLQTIEMAKKAKDTGVDVLLCIVPYYNKPNQEAVTLTLLPSPSRRTCLSSFITYRAVQAAKSNRRRSASWLMTSRTSSASKTPAATSIMPLRRSQCTGRFPPLQR